MSQEQTIALIGTGIMGHGMGHQLLEAGFALRVWNRTASKTEELVTRGAHLCDSPADAARDADVVITMVTDGDAVDAVASGGDGLLEGIAEGAVWAQMSTVSIDEQEDFAARAEGVGAEFVDAPVLGTKAPAEQGTLIVLAACDEEMRGRLESVFDAVGQKTMWVGHPGGAIRLKLVCNTWVLGLLGVLGETIALAEGLDVHPSNFLEAISGGALDAQYAHIKGSMMLDGEYPAAFPLKHALKDSNLIQEAARRAGIEPRMMRAIADAFEEVIDEYGEADMAAIVEAYRTRR
ncbi:MAG: NAD(P)-dependent oxidoreductase [Myxococcota bacterium]